MDPMAACSVCGARSTVAIGALCAACAGRLHTEDALVPEQITSRPIDAPRAVLIDRWGRVHAVGARATIGRRREDQLQIADPSVSRVHAELRLTAAGDAWLLRDLGSTNGTRVGDQRAAGDTPVTLGEALWFGRVGFVLGAPAACQQASERSAVVHTARAILVDDGGAAVAGGLELVEPSGGGGGFLRCAGRRVQLSAAQFELLVVLRRRAQGEAGRPEEVRGFVRSSELLASLSWDTAHPQENHLKQLVRRVRRLLARDGLDDLIEGRQGLGYRLRPGPRLPLG
jgi:hypothetical protein